MVLYNLLSLKDHEIIVLWNSTISILKQKTSGVRARGASCLVSGQGDMEKLSDKCSSGLRLDCPILLVPPSDIMKPKF